MASALYAQNYYDSLLIEGDKNMEQEKQGHFSFQTGFMLSKYGDYSEALNYNFPSYNCLITPRLKVDVGIIQLKQLYNSFLDEDFNIKNPGSLFFVSNGTYLVNKNISISGSVVKRVTEYAGTSIYTNSNAIENYSLRVNYKISSNINFGFEFRRSELNNPLYYYPW
ncbi:MAG: hypothetical protein JXB17_06720 [Bacteroidales bacterium]|nr:hypothetical protein [Bacteroidales bacterium]